MKEREEERLKLLKEYGYDKTKAREVSQDITKYYTEIAKQNPEAKVKSR